MASFREFRWPNETRPFEGTVSMQGLRGSKSTLLIELNPIRRGDIGAHLVQEEMEPPPVKVRQ